MINPELAELVAFNSSKVKVNYFCDYSSLGSEVVAYVRKKCFLWAELEFNIGRPLLNLVASSGEHDLSNKINRAWLNSSFLHEYLHLSLSPESRETILQHSSGSERVAFANDIVYSQSNFAFRTPVKNEGKNFPTPIVPSIYGLDAVSSVAISGNVFTTQKCLTAVGTQIIDGELMSNILSNDEQWNIADTYCENVDSKKIFIHPDNKKTMDVFRNKK